MPRVSRSSPASSLHRLFAKVPFRTDAKESITSLSREVKSFGHEFSKFVKIAPKIPLPPHSSRAQQRRPTPLRLRERAALSRKMVLPAVGANNRARASATASHTAPCLTSSLARCVTLQTLARLFPTRAATQHGSGGDGFPLASEATTRLFKRSRREALNHLAGAVIVVRGLNTSRC